MDLLNHPERACPAILVAGTNGKGSTATVVATILQAAGHRVGLYTSPHLVDFPERIRVNGTPIPWARVTVLTEMLRARWEEESHSAPREERPTFFEFTTAQALQYFAEESVGIAVLEVGLGGRYDATNVVTPIVSAITTLDYDHESLLGPTLSRIAAEKAGIIRPGVPVVSAAQPPEAAAVLEDVCKQRGAPLVSLGREVHVRGECPSNFTYLGQSLRLNALMCPLAGRHQLHNLGVALGVLEQLRKPSCGAWRISEHAIRLGLKGVQVVGRLEVLETDPCVLLDGAHNPGAAKALAAYLQEVRPTYGHIILVIGIMRDKQISAILHHLAARVDEIILTRADSPRAADPSDLARAMPAWTGQLYQTQTVGEAVALARVRATARDLIVIAGSFYVAGEAKVILHGDESPSLLRG